MLGIRQLRHTPEEVKRRMQFDHIRLHQSAPRLPSRRSSRRRLRELFAEDVARLGALLGRDLAAWTRGEALEPVREVTV